MKKGYNATNIKWKNESELVYLSNEYEIPDSLLIPTVEKQEVAKWLEEKTGFEPEDFSIEEVEDDCKCVYCQIKNTAKRKTIFYQEAENGKCVLCDSYIDPGQHSVRVNGYADIYKGAIKLLDGMVERFNDILKYYDVELEEDVSSISLYSTEIIEALFIPSYGGTTKGNFRNAIGITENELEWELGEDSRYE